MDDFRIKISSDLDLSKAESKINNFLNKYNGKDKIKLNVDIDSQSISRLEKKINNLKKSISSTSNVKTNIGSGLNKTTNAAKKDFQILKNLANEISKKKITLAGLDTSKNENQIKILSSQLKKLESDYKVLSKTLGSNLNASQIGELEKIFGKASDQVDILKAKSKDLEKTFSSISKPFSQMDAIAAGNKTLSWLKNNSNAAKKYGETLEKLAEQQKSATNNEDLRNYTKQVNAIKAEASALGKTGKSFSEELSRGFKQIAQFAGTYGLIQEVPQLIMRSVSELKEMDDILIEISKTSDLTTSQLKQLGKDSFDNASKYGKTANEYLLGVQEMSRSGFYGKQGEAMAELSILGQAAGDMSADVSNAYLLATNAAYGYKGSVEKLTAVLDGQNYITNRHSVSMLDMAEATTQAGSMAAQSGVQVNELSALIGTAVARTKKSGNEIGTALKALFINLQNTQNKKIVATFEDLGLSMTKMVGDSEMLKTPIELLKELSTIYNTLPEGSKQKADILTNIGGKHHANVLSAVLSGYSDYEKMLSDYSQGIGSAAIEAQKSADGWSGSVNKLSNAWTSFISNFANTDLIIGATNALTGFVKVLDTLTSNPLLLGGTAGAIGGGIAFAKNLDKPKIIGFA